MGQTNLVLGIPQEFIVATSLGVDGFAKAYNAHDAKAVAALFAKTNPIHGGAFIRFRP